MSSHDLKKCIDLCLECAAACNHCTAECLKEKELDHFRRCIQLNTECSVLCYAAAQLLSIESERMKDLCMLCVHACYDCGIECSKHSEDHCRECAVICRKCAMQCEYLVAENLSISTLKA
jgi:hypothetical protein